METLERNDRVATVGEWQDIATVPKGGSEFLAALPDGKVRVIWVNYEDEDGINWGYYSGWGSTSLESDENPVAWMPLPEAPKEAGDVQAP